MGPGSARSRRRGKSKRYPDLVTLTDALGREEAAARPAMIAQHLACLMALTAACDRGRHRRSRNELGAPELGLPVLMFASEPAAAIQPSEYRDQLPPSLVAACEQVINTTTITGATAPG